MMYHKKVAAAIKVNGKILREQGDLVALPFGSEYSILIKNLNSVRIQVRVQIDGTDVTEGTWIVIGANSSVELERFIKNSNWNYGNKFKFIERTAGIEEHRGIKVDDGLVRIEYQTEQKVEVETIRHTEYVSSVKPDRRRPRRWNDSHPWYGDRRRSSSDVLRSAIGPKGMGSNSGFTFTTENVVNLSGSTSAGYFINTTPTAESACFAASAAPAPQSDVGITVAGDISHQSFSPAAWFETTGVTDVIVFHLKGKIGEKSVSQPVTVAYKPKCVTCGRTNKATNKFCAECGTALELV